MSPFAFLHSSAFYDLLLPKASLQARTALHFFTFDPSLTTFTFAAFQAPFNSLHVPCQSVSKALLSFLFTLRVKDLQLSSTSAELLLTPRKQRFLILAFIHLQL